MTAVTVIQSLVCLASHRACLLFRLKEGMIPGSSLPHMGNVLHQAEALLQSVSCSSAVLATAYSAELHMSCPAMLRLL